MLITCLQCDDVGDHMTPHGYAHLRHDEHQLNDVRSNGGRLLNASSISANNYTFIEPLTVNIEKLCSYNIDHNS